MRFYVSGMSCAACSARVEKAVLQVSDVVSCTVSLLTNQMTVEGSASPDVIIEAVKAAGYDAVVIQNDGVLSSDLPDKTDDQTGFLLRKLLFSLCFLIPLMLLSMGGVMLEWSVFRFFRSKPLALCLCEMVLCLAVLAIHRRFFFNGFKGLFHGSPNMDTLVSVGSLASFLYSMAIAVTIIKYQSVNQIEAGWQNLHHLYFDSSAMILVLITVGKILEARSKGKTTEALSSLLKMAPKTARLIKNGKEIVIPVSELQVGDCFAVKPGDSIPADGEVISGESSVNEAYLTGESMPVEKAAGSPVFSATLNTNGYMQCRVTKTGDETTHAQIIKLISDAAATKAPAARIADRVAAVFVPAVMIIAMITAIIWILITHTFSDALLRGVSVLVVSCPCALGLATPVAIMVGNGVGAKNGILFKTAAALEDLGKAQIVVLDKTGTITAGKPCVKELFPYNGYTENDLLTIAASMEEGSEHPLAKAVLAEAEKREIQRKAVDDFEARSGYGVIGIIDGKPAYVGKESFVLSMMGIHELPQQLLQKSSCDDLTQIWIGMDHELLGFITVEDLIKPDSKQAVAEMGQLCDRIIMLSGDRKDTAQKVADQIGLKEFIPEVLPGQKEETIRRLKENHVVLMVGDGLNDAPALMRADIGCAIGNGTNVAIEAADVVLMNNRLTDVCAGIRLSRATLRVIRQNLFWALCYNLIGIPLAAGAFIPILHWELQPMFCAAMMSLSSIIVVSNALRINRFALFDPKFDKKIISKKKGRIEMEKTFKTEGMMCCHCENHVKKALMAIDGVTDVAANHETGLVTVIMNKMVTDDALKGAIEEEGYKVLEKV